MIYADKLFRIISVTAVLGCSFHFNELTCRYHHINVEDLAKDDMLLLRLASLFLFLAAGR